MMYYRYLTLIPIVFGIILAATVMTGIGYSPVAYNDGFVGNVGKDKNYMQFTQDKDTLYVLGNTYIILDLKEQKARLYRRHDSTVTFRVSSGNPSLTKGIETPVGLYTVQNKSPIAISKQFENAEMYHWVGFNGNIGFHGLKGNGYYARLGFKPSSHGCVRISREDGEKLYNLVQRGTPVLVFKDPPARVLAFAEDSDYNPNTDFIISGKPTIIYKMIKERLKDQYEGLVLRNNLGKVFFDGNYILHNGGFEVGVAEKIANIQKLPINLKTYGADQRDYSDNYHNHQFVTDRCRLNF